MNSSKKKILLAGGGTLGSVSPLLAIAANYPADYLFVGTTFGPEREFVLAQGIANFKSIKSGKLRRYFDTKNFSDAFRIVQGFFQSLQIIWNFRPDIVLTAGSFVAVPLVWAAWLLRKPVIVHQQDMMVGLANRLMAPFAQKITVVFPEQLKDFDNRKTVITGNPVRSVKIDLERNEPLVLITGGGLGARTMNEFVKQFIPKILAAGFEVYHLLGAKNSDQALSLDGYYSDKFVNKNMMDILARADIVISRAGMSSISEAAVLKKPLVLIPMTGTHQERNAAFLAKKNAALMIPQYNYKIMDRYLDKLLNKADLRQALGDNLYNLFPQNAINNYIILINQILDDA